MKQAFRRPIVPSPVAPDADRSRAVRTYPNSPRWGKDRRRSQRADRPAGRRDTNVATAARDHGPARAPVLGALPVSLRYDGGDPGARARQAAAVLELLKLAADGSCASATDGGGGGGGGGGGLRDR